MDVCVVLCVWVEASRRADPPSKEYNRLYITLRNPKKEARAQQKSGNGTIEPNEEEDKRQFWNNFIQNNPSLLTPHLYLGSPLPPSPPPPVIQ
jgi:hypothetical protein